MNVNIFQKNYIIVAVAIVASFIITFILNLVSKQKDQNKVYMKSAITVALTSAVIVYLHTLNPIVEDIITTPVPF